LLDRNRLTKFRSWDCFRVYTVALS